MKAISTYITSNLFFLGSLIFALYVLFAVPQISNLWMQFPPIYGGWQITLLFLLFVFGLALFYGGSLILNHSWKKYGTARRDPTQWSTHSLLWRIIVFLPAVASEWLIICAFGRRNPTQASTHKQRVSWLVIAVIASITSVMIFTLGAARAGSRAYILAGAYCQFIGVWLVFLFMWLIAINVFTKTVNHQFAFDLLIHAGRLLGWLLVTSLVGEVLWIGACNEVPFLSFRLFSIWAMIETLIGIVLVCQWLDSSSQLYPGLVRPAVMAGLVYVIWTATHSDLVDDKEVKQHLSASTADLLPTDMQKTNLLWFDAFDHRLKLIDDGPFVFVAASGGGSRAAIFTALCLSLLERTPLDPRTPLVNNMNQNPRPRTWADQIVMLSSVSGGSLATAHWLQRWGSQDKDLNDLVHTTKKELLHYLEQFSQKGFMAYPTNQLKQTLLQPADSNQDRVTAIAAEWSILINEMAKEEDPEKRLEYGNTRILKLHSQRQELKRILLDLLKPVVVSSNKPKQESDLGRLNTAQTKQRIDFVNRLNGSLDQFFACYWTYRYFHMLKMVGGDEYAFDEKISSLNEVEREVLLRFRWILRSSGFDLMCTDFMAPLFRGVLAPTLDRGDALAKFWTEQFGWHDCTNLRGFMHKDGAQPYSQGRPLAIFNACDAAMGCRLTFGFPDLPHDLWKNDYVNRPEYTLPESYREVAVPIEMSLSRVVRFSSNFPFGFRAQQLATTADRERVNVLDGGVSDNTGLDTLREMFAALVSHAANPNSNYAARSQSILDKLKQRGVIVLEVDSGGKPSEALPHGPFAGVFLPVQALNNAAYSTAAIAKSHYYSEIERVLKCSRSEFTRLLSLPGNASGQVQDIELGSQYFQLPSVFVETTLQCNHYRAGEKPSEADVMTAWSLGPKDKADVVGRFLQELTHWEGKRELMSSQFGNKMNIFQQCKKQAENTIVKSRLKARLDLLLSQFTQALSVANTNDSVLRTTIDRLIKSAQEIQAELSILLPLEDMEELHQWNEVLPRSVKIMKNTRSTLSSSNGKSENVDKQKVLSSARQSVEAVTNTFSVSRPGIIVDQTNQYNALKARDSQVRQYYEQANKKDPKNVAIPQTGQPPIKK